MPRSATATAAQTKAARRLHAAIEATRTEGNLTGRQSPSSLGAYLWPSNL